MHCKMCVRTELCSRMEKGEEYVNFSIENIVESARISLRCTCIGVCTAGGFVVGCLRPSHVCG